MIVTSPPTYLEVMIIQTRSKIYDHYLPTHSNIVLTHSNIVNLLVAAYTRHVAKFQKVETYRMAEFQ